MGGKGKRRREKNFLAAHGGNTRLPPPPKATDIDALPTKLRLLMDFMSPSPPSTKIPQSQGNAARASKDAKNESRKEGPNSNQNEHSTVAPKFKEQDNHENVTTLEHKGHNNNKSTDDKGKRKRKRKAAEDLRFQNTNQDLATTSLSKRERRKKYLEARKKKHKKGKTDESPDFPVREEIEFGEVVEAPPKMLTLPKGKKTSVTASHERLRLQAVEAYRNRKGWASRPGIQVPPVTANLSS